MKELEQVVLDIKTSADLLNNALKELGEYCYERNIDITESSYILTRAEKEQLKEIISRAVDYL